MWCSCSPDENCFAEQRSESRLSLSKNCVVLVIWRPHGLECGRIDFILSFSVLEKGEGRPCKGMYTVVGVFEKCKILIKTCRNFYYSLGRSGFNVFIQQEGVHKASNKRVGGWAGLIFFKCFVSALPIRRMFTRDSFIYLCIFSLSLSLSLSLSQ